MSSLPAIKFLAPLVKSVASAMALIWEGNDVDVLMRPQPLMPVQLKSGRPVNAGRDAQQIGLLVKGHRGRIAQYRQVLTRG